MSEEIEKLAEIINGNEIIPEGKCFEHFDSWAEWHKYKYRMLQQAQRVLDAGYRQIPELTVLSDEDMDKIVTPLGCEIDCPEDKNCEDCLKSLVAEAQFQHTKRELKG